MKPKIPKLKKGDMVLIEWTDTNVPLSTDWMSDKEHSDWVAQEAGSVVKTIGFFISKDKNFISLVGDINAEECDSEAYLRPINVGIGYIAKLTVLKEKK